MIVNAAFEIIRKNGTDALNARSVAAELGCSTQPVFSNFASMDDLKNELFLIAGEKYNSYIKAGMTSNKYPPYKASGMAYIRFAREERELFRMLFMRDRTGEDKTHDFDEIENLIEIIGNNLSISKLDAKRLHLEMWIFVHGIATMLVTGTADYTEEEISCMLTDAYKGLSSQVKENAN